MLILFRCYSFRTTIIYMSNLCGHLHDVCAVLSDLGGYFFYKNPKDSILERKMEPL